MIIYEPNYIIINFEVNAFLFLHTLPIRVINIFISILYGQLLGAIPMGIGFTPIKMSL